jgi:hypothetical protein
MACETLPTAAPSGEGAGVGAVRGAGFGEVFESDAVMTDRS